MNWPTMSDYQEAIQNPANCFTDPALKSGTPALNALGLPTPVTGGFCSVYQVGNGKTRWAVRCFLHNIKDLRDRYPKISSYLRWKRLKQMVGFDYVPEGIKVRPPGLLRTHMLFALDKDDGGLLALAYPSEAAARSLPAALSY